MMDMRALQELQRDTGFSGDFIEKVYHIAQVLFELQGDKIAGVLALKGGTALNFVYLDTPRLSIDLDFNFIGAAGKEEMLRTRPSIAEGVARIAGGLGYEVAKKPSSYIMERFQVKYKTLKGVSDSIKVEINYLERVPFMGKARRKFRHFFSDIPKFTINTYTVEEICAMKTKAMSERLYARDLFDIHSLSKLSLDKEKLRKLMILYLLIARRKPGIEALTSKIKEYHDERSLQQLSQFTTRGRALDVAAIKRQAIEFYEDVFKLDDNDKKFLGMIEQGVIDLDVLFADIKYNKRAQKHPSLYHALFERPGKHRE